jgi:hypothetical protein
MRRPALREDEEMDLTSQLRLLLTKLPKLTALHLRGLELILSQYCAWVWRVRIRIKLFRSMRIQIEGLMTKICKCYSLRKIAIFKLRNCSFCIP